MDFSDSFRIVNLAVGVIMVLGGISQFFNLGLYVPLPQSPLPSPHPSLNRPPRNSQSIIIGAYVLIFGLAVALLEFQIPPQVSRYASFMFSFLGRGLFYVFVGSLLLNHGVLRVVAGSAVAAVGLAYVALEFVPSVEPPANMREADAGWGAEQV
ncbi:COPI associated [Daldinia bambusicola]|nr:COPI associated [Daldinia bambusicola]